MSTLTTASGGFSLETAVDSALARVPAAIRRLTCLKLRGSRSEQSPGPACGRMLHPAADPGQRQWAYTTRL